MTEENADLDNSKRDFKILEHRWVHQKETQVEAQNGNWSFEALLEKFYQILIPDVSWVMPGRVFCVSIPGEDPIYLIRASQEIDAGALLVLLEPQNFNMKRRIPTSGRLNFKHVQAVGVGHQ